MEMLSKILLYWYVANLTVIALVAGYCLHHRLSESPIIIAVRMLLIFCCLVSVGQVLVGAQLQVRVFQVGFTFAIAALGINYVFTEFRQGIQEAKERNARTELAGNKAQASSGKSSL